MNGLNNDIITHMCYNIDMKKMSEYNDHMGMVLRIYPSDKQKIIIKRNGIASRFLYNRLVAVNNEIWKLKKSAPYSVTDASRLVYLEDMYKDVRSIKASIPFLYESEIDSDMVYNTVSHYKSAWKMFKTVKGTKVPSFHRFDNTYSYKTSNHYNKKSTNGLTNGSIRFLDSRHLNLPKIGHIRFKGSDKKVNELLNRKDETRIGTTKIWMDQTGKCYVSLSFGSDIPFCQMEEKTSEAVGIDVNLSNFYTDSNGNKIESPKYLVRSEKKLKKMQKRLSRKQEAAKRDNTKLSERKKYAKLRAKLAKLHKHIAAQRKAFHRYLASQIVKAYDFIFAEDLKVRNLKRNHKLAKAISDSGWRQFLTTLQWCASKRGKLCLLVNPKNTTQTCSHCGHVCTGDEHIELGIEEWDCPHCGTHHIRDHNAAINIKNNGLQILKEAGLIPA